MDRHAPPQRLSWDQRSRADLQRAIRRRRRRRWRVTTRLILPLVVLGAATGFLVSWRTSSPGGSGHLVGAAAGARVTTTTVPPTTTTTTSAGSLPQTDQLPTVDAQFDSEVDALWIGIRTNSVTTAMPAFFPEQAYVQLKTIADPAGDFEDRLVANYGMDITAASQLVASDPGTPTLLGVLVPEQYAHWIPPDVCDNSIGYYEVANSRIVYEQDGVTRSFGIASLISWRGEWYVVHLGAILRSSNTGVVLDPETGTGTSPDSTTC